MTNRIDRTKRMALTLAGGSIKERVERAKRIIAFAKTMSTISECKEGNTTTSAEFTTLIDRLKKLETAWATLFVQLKKTELQDMRVQGLLARMESQMVVHWRDNRSFFIISYIYDNFINKALQ